MEGTKSVAVSLVVVVIFSGIGYASVPLTAASAAANQSNLTITDASLSDSEIVTGGSTTVTADVTSQTSPFQFNTFDINLKIDGSVVDTKTVLLQGGESTTVSFEQQFSEQGEYDISVNSNSAGTVRVLAPADLGVSDLSLDPNPVVEGNPTDIEATVQNDGDVEGQREIDLRVDGSVAATQSVTVAGQSSQQITFERTFDSPGEYEIQVSDSGTETLTVEQAAEFELSDTTLSPPEIREGESTTISGTVSNVGGGVGEYTAILSVDGSNVAEQTVEVEPGQSQQVTFDRTFEDRGEYSISIGNTEVGTLTVLAPADLSVTDTAVNSNTITTDESVRVDATVENAGDITGSMNLSFEVDGETVASKQVTVRGQQSETVQFTERFDRTGEFDLGINGDPTGTVRVLAPAEFVVTDASVSPGTILEGNTSTTEATIENVGDVEGSFVANLTVDGSTVAAKSVTVAGGETTTVSFERAFNSRGSYQVGVSGESAGELTVEAPASISVRKVGVSERTILENNRVRIFGVVENTGDRTGSYEAILNIDRDSVDRQRLEVPGRETQRVAFGYQFDTPGTYDIAVNDEEGGEITVEQPATFREIGATANVTRTIEGNPVGVELTVQNVGDRTGTYRAALSAAGTRRSVQAVTLDGGETKSVTVTERFADSGAYRLTFNETSTETVVVQEPPELEVRNASVPADLVAPGERTAVEYTVANPGNWTVTERINITADGALLAQERVTVDPGERREVTTQFDGTAGQIAVDGVDAGSVETIEETAPGRSQPGDDGDGNALPLSVALLVGLLVIVIGIAGVYFVDLRR